MSLEHLRLSRHPFQSSASHRGEEGGPSGHGFSLVVDSALVEELGEALRDHAHCGVVRVRVRLRRKVEVRLPEKEKLPWRDAGPSSSSSSLLSSLELSDTKVYEP